MDAKQLKALCEQLGFGIAHVRRVPRKTELRAYVAMRHPQHGDVDEIRFDPAVDDGEIRLFQHATKPNGWTQYDKHVGTMTVADLMPE